MRRCGLLNGNHTVSKRKRHPKACLAVDCSTHMILACLPARGPGGDHTLLPKLLPRLAKNFSVKTLLADAGFDTEKCLQLIRHQHQMEPIVPPLRTINKEVIPQGAERRRMFYAFQDGTPAEYHQRWQVETVMSMVKRNIKHALSARSYHSQNKESFLIALTHNIAIAMGTHLFYRAHPCLLLQP